MVVVDVVTVAYGVSRTPLVIVTERVVTTVVMVLSAISMSKTQKISCTHDVGV